MTLTIKARGEPRALIDPVRREIRSADPTLPACRQSRQGKTIERVAVRITAFVRNRRLEWPPNPSGSIGPDRSQRLRPAELCPSSDTSPSLEADLLGRRAHEEVSMSSIPWPDARAGRQRRWCIAT